MEQKKDLQVRANFLDLSSIDKDWSAESSLDSDSDSEKPSPKEISLPEQVKTVSKSKKRRNSSAELANAPHAKKARSSAKPVVPPANENEGPIMSKPKRPIQIDISGSKEGISEYRDLDVIPQRRGAARNSIASSKTAKQAILSQWGIFVCLYVFSMNFPF